MTKLFHLDHRKPLTRRALLGQGFLTGAGLLAVPSLLSLLMEQQAVAAGLTCASGAAGGPKALPFIAFDLAGGGNIAGSNVLVGKRNGQGDFLTSYLSLGLPDAMSPAKDPSQINSEYGLLFHKDSAILRGMNLVTTTATRSAVDGAVFCTSSGDDSAANPHNPMYWILKAGSPGELISLTRAAASGKDGPHGPAASPADSIIAAAKPVLIAKPADVLGLIDPGKLAKLLAPADVAKILEAARAMSASKLRMFQAKDLNAQIRDLVECGYLNGGELVAKSADAKNYDATQDTRVTDIFTTLKAGATPDPDEARVAAIAKLVLEGKAAAGTIEMDGFDYHNGSRATGEAKDQNVGKLIGQCLQLAAAMKTDLMIYVFTDGGVISSGKVDDSTGGRGKGSWTSDSNNISAAFTLVYNKDGVRPALAKDTIRQIGAFNDAGGVDQNINKISSSVDALTRAVTGNYLALQGLEGSFAKVVGADPFGASLGDYLAFKKLR